jgi:hypothetical protein
MSQNVGMIGGHFILKLVDVLLEFIIKTIEHLIHTISIAVALGHSPIQLIDILFSVLDYHTFQFDMVGLFNK